ncbi:MAG: metalloregulator ArsR/SmtB family transcription factor [Pseudomonadota bacterium]|nr:metalloregulator ArsR/SmtB family transcription factor [Pseudomonadota bacterium]
MVREAAFHNSRAGPRRLDVFKALADPTRRAILSSLRRGAQPVTTIASEFPISRPAISRHLRVLLRADLVRETRDGRNRRYRLKAKRLKEVDDWIGAYRRMWVAELQNLKHYLEAKVKGH